MKDKYTNSEIDKIAKNSIEEIECSEVWESYLKWKANGNKDKCYIDYFEHLLNELFDFLDSFSIEKSIKLLMEASTYERRN